jgi:hypothetical protein
MKKAIALTTLAIILLLGSCKKETVNVEVHHPSSNRVITIASEAKSSFNTFLVMSIGHNGSNCSGCIWDNGKYIHRDCMGPGNYCVKSVAVALIEDGNNLYAVTLDTFDLTTGNIYLMPGRSLEYINENNEKIYLNIPFQTMYRDPSTLQFTFTGLSFSSSPVYNNI